MGRYSEGERLCRRALAIQERSLGPENAELSGTLDNLASNYRGQSRLESALELSRRALQISRNTYGDSHPFTCKRLRTVTVLEANLGHLGDAQGFLQGIVEVQRQALGEQSPALATTIANLAAVKFRQGLPLEAETLYRQAVLILDRSRSNDHKLAEVFTNFAWLLRQTGRRGEAKKMELRAGAISRNGNTSGRFAVDISERGCKTDCVNEFSDTKQGEQGWN